MKPIITYDQFSAMDIRVGRIINAEAKEGSEKLLRLKVNFGDEGERNILSGIAKWYKPENLIGKDFIFIINLEPRSIMGEMSEGMIMAADGKKPILLKPKSKATPGATIH